MNTSIKTQNTNPQNTQEDFIQEESQNLLNSFPSLNIETRKLSDIENAILILKSLITDLEDEIEDGQYND